MPSFFVHSKNKISEWKEVLHILKIPRYAATLSPVEGFPI